MIYTVTLNPCVDYIIRMDEIVKGKVNKTKSENFFVGGKGINVKINDGDETDINGQGPDICKKDKKEFFKKLDKLS